MIQKIEIHDDRIIPEQLEARAGESVAFTNKSTALIVKFEQSPFESTMTQFPLPPDATAPFQIKPDAPTGEVFSYVASHSRPKFMPLVADITIIEGE